jgi:hypothetical protein
MSIDRGKVLFRDPFYHVIRSKLLMSEMGTICGEQVEKGEGGEEWG